MPQKYISAPCGCKKVRTTLGKKTSEKIIILCGRHNITLERAVQKPGEIKKWRRSIFWYK